MLIAQQPLNPLRSCIPVLEYFDPNDNTCIGTAKIRSRLSTGRDTNSGLIKSELQS